MAEEAAVAEAAPASGKGSKKMMIMGGIVAGILLVQGAVVFFVVKAINKGPAEAVGIEIPKKDAHQLDAHSAKEDTAEVMIANQFECPHTITGRLYVIRMTVSATVPQSLVGAPEGEGKEKEKEKAKEEEGKEGEGQGGGIAKEIEKNIATIKDRMRTIIAGADASTLYLARSEKPDYGLSTLRRQFKTVLDEVLGKGKVKDVLISDYMPTPVD